MMKIQESSLLTEKERVKSSIKLTPEERKKEVRRRIYIELKAIEMVRRQRVASETLAKTKREREEREKATELRMRQEAKQREEEVRRAKDQKALEKAKQLQLKQERLLWQQVMIVEEQLKRPSISALTIEQQRRREEAELCCLPKVGGKASPECLTSDLRAKQQIKKKTLHNNWVGEQKTDSKPVKDKSDPNSSVYLLFAAKPGPKPQEKPKTPEPSESLQWLQRLKVDYWVDKYRDLRQRKRERRELKAQEQYARWTAFKESRASQFSRRYDIYTAGFAADRNSILNIMF